MTEHQQTSKIEIERTIIEFIEHELVDAGDTVEPDHDLLSGEVLDSMAVMRLVAFVEDTFSIAIQPSDFVVENFQSVKLLSDFVERSVTRDV